MPVPSLAQLAADAILDRCTSDDGLEEELEHMAAESREGPGLGGFVLELLRRHTNLEYLISTNSLFVYEEMPGESQSTVMRKSAQSFAA